MQSATASAPLTVARSILNAARRFPQSVAVEADGRSLSYAELADRLRRVGAAAVSEYGLRAGDVVALLSPNRIEYLEIVAGLAEAGLVVATLNPRLSPEELIAIIDDCRPALALVDPALDELQHTLVQDTLSTHPGYRRTVRGAPRAGERRGHTAGRGVQCFQYLLHLRYDRAPQGRRAATPQPRTGLPRLSHRV